MNTQLDPITTQNINAMLQLWPQVLQKLQARDNPTPQSLLQSSQTAQQAMQQFWQQAFTNPEPFINRQLQWWQDCSQLWQQAQAENILQESKSDKRFADPDWSQQTNYQFIKNAYLKTCEHFQAMLEDVSGLDPKSKQQLQFFTRQFLNALAPTNFVFTNPEIMRLTLESKGDNLVKGLRNLLSDLDRDDGPLRIKMTDLDAFEVGGNLAITPGAIVFENELLQLIQYTPQTATVFKRPLLIIPPWINKYYILDLQPHNSFVQAAVKAGHSVFLISWVNPDAKLANYDFNAYLHKGTLAALDAVEQISGSKQTNTLGFCIGGTLQACMLGYLAKQQQLNRISSATYLATMLDFNEPGELGVYISEQQVSALEQEMSAVGYLDGRKMAMAFNMLRDNDLIWSYFVNNYLAGREPFPFDLLYWNFDATNMPAAMHSFYLRQMYLYNNLIKANGLILGDTAINLAEIDIPVYFISTEQDHIAPWVSTYAGALAHSGAVRFVLGGSGHIAGIINPPEKNKYAYRVAPGKLAPTAQEWLAAAQTTPGSWWLDWHAWLGQNAGSKHKARAVGSEQYPVIEAAPGRYVKASLHSATAESTQEFNKNDN